MARRDRSRSGLGTSSWSRCVLVSAPRESGEAEMNITPLRPASAMETAGPAMVPEGVQLTGHSNSDNRRTLPISCRTWTFPQLAPSSWPPPPCSSLPLLWLRARDPERR